MLGVGDKHSCQAEVSAVTSIGEGAELSWSPGLKKWVVDRPSKFYRLLQAGAHPLSDWHLLFQFSTSRWRSEIAFPGPDPRVSWLAARAPSRWPSSPEILCCVPCVPFVPCGRPGIFRRALDVQSSSRVAKLQLALCTLWCALGSQVLPH